MRTVTKVHTMLFPSIRFSGKTPEQWLPLGPVTGKGIGNFLG